MENRLRSVPAKRRDDELREMCRHLLDAVEAEREQGLTEDDAVRAALTTFGPPEQTADVILEAQRRVLRKLSMDAFRWGSASNAIFYIWLFFQDTVTSHRLVAIGVWVATEILGVLLMVVAPRRRLPVGEPTATVPHG